jgi:hypothetical protein
MKKNKKITYLLIVLVGLIWGVVFYKIYSNFGGNRQMKNNTPSKVAAIETEKSDSIFPLTLNYPDPFLKGMGQPTGIPVKNKDKPKVNWPLIEYRGLLTNNIKKESTGLLKVQNSNLLVKQGKVYSGVKVRTMMKDSIFLEYLSEVKWIRIVAGGQLLVAGKK